MQQNRTSTWFLPSPLTSTPLSAALLLWRSPLTFSPAVRLSFPPPTDLLPASFSPTIPLSSLLLPQRSFSCSESVTAGTRTPTRPPLTLTRSLTRAHATDSEWTSAVGRAAVRRPAASRPALLCRVDECLRAPAETARKIGTRCFLSPSVLASLLFFSPPFLRFLLLFS